ncbi:hypothetical protein DPMN_015634 [Dreissena polymorpha]|uniref:Uncharacterized protein n=1 Tax=Dreissena polymorpha TaxID=45954 RepID=A0A9D4N9J0_DREPO|nr:hypothetical protein DPMN_015634 [Dreissena polymorpha]
MKIGHEIFELCRDFIGTKLLTKFHEDGTRNQMLTDGRTYDGQRPVTKAHLRNQYQIKIIYDRTRKHTALLHSPGLKEEKEEHDDDWHYLDLRSFSFAEATTKKWIFSM